MSGLYGLGWLAGFASSRALRLLCRVGVHVLVLPYEHGYACVCWLDEEATR